MTFSLAQWTGADNTPAGAQQVFTLAFVSNTTAGNLIVVALFDGEGQNATCTVADNLNPGNYTLDAQGNIPVDGDTASVFSKVVTVGGATTVTLTRPVNIGGSFRFAIHEFHDSTGSFPASPTDQMAQGYNAGSTSAASASTSTLAQANELVFGAVMQSQTTSGPDTAGGGASLAANANGLPFKVATDWIGVSATTAVSASFTLGASDEWRCFCVTYKGATQNNASIAWVV